MGSEDQGDAPLHHIIQRIWQTDAQSLLRIGEGVYGRCYGVIFGCSPYRAVIKVYKYPGIADQERRQLIELRAHIPVLVPHIYAYLPETELGEALVMEWLPGQSCPRPEHVPPAQRALLHCQVVDLLSNLHRIEHPEGYGSFDGPLYPRWWDYYGQRVRSTSQAIHGSEEARLYLGSQVLIHEVRLTRLVGDLLTLLKEHGCLIQVETPVPSLVRFPAQTRCSALPLVVHIKPVRIVLPDGLELRHDRDPSRTMSILYLADPEAQNKRQEE